jgi:hypothetical protein
MPTAERYTRAWMKIESDLDLVLGGVSKALQRLVFKEAHRLCIEADDRRRIYVKCADRPLPRHSCARSLER